MDAALFRMADGLAVPTEYCRGPWDPGLAHGGPMCGLVSRAAELLTGAGARHPAPWLCARLTVELFAGVPIAPLAVDAQLTKDGRRTRVVDVVVRRDDRVVVRASSLWVAAGDSALHPGASPPARPDVPADPGSSGWDYPRPGFNCDAVELRPLHGSTEESGPAAIWSRLAVPLVAGETTSRFAAVATLADLGGAVSWQYGPGGASFINPDITLQLNRLPVDEWVLLDGRNHVSGDTVGFNEVVLSDGQGPFGRVLQTLVESPHRLHAAGPTEGAGGR